MNPHRGEHREKFSFFKREAALANWVPRLYEAATTEDGPDVPRIIDLLELDDDTLGSAEELTFVIDSVRGLVAAQLTHVSPWLRARRPHSMPGYKREYDGQDRPRKAKRSG